MPQWNVIETASSYTNYANVVRIRCIFDLHVPIICKSDIMCALQRKKLRQNNNNNKKMPPNKVRDNQSVWNFEISGGHKISY